MPTQEVRALDFEVTSDGEAEKLRSTMQFTAIQDGLEFTDHSVAPRGADPGLHETSIAIFGLPTALYWNGLRAEAGHPQSSLPNTVRLISGRPFDPKSSFVIERTAPDESVSVHTCHPAESFPATTLNTLLSGMVIMFECITSPYQIRSKYWYLSDAQRYITHEVFVRDWLQARIKLIAVHLR